MLSRFPIPHMSNRLSATPLLTVATPVPKRKNQNFPKKTVYPPIPMPGGYGVMGADGSMDYSVHEAWNEATNVYLVVILVSFGLFMYAKR
ncbi:hypothetical protein CB1_001095051 [Camelus ferus]|nr:hypothetical protein CB1_001095051 [Camelus ferus]